MTHTCGFPSTEGESVLAWAMAPGSPRDGPVACPGPPGPPTQLPASSLTLTQLGPKKGLPSRAEAKLTTHDTGRDEVPPAVTDRSPLVVHEHFHPALTHLGSRAQAHPWLLLGENWL